MECYCYLRNLQDLLSDRKTPYERRFGEPLKGPVIPRGSMVKKKQFLVETSEDSTTSGRKSCSEYSSVVHCTREESGKETLW